MSRRACILALALALALACRPSAPAGQAAASTTAPAPPPSAPRPAGPDIRSFFVTPSDSGLEPVLDGIAAAKKSIHMMMFHLTVPEVVDALVAAVGRGVDVRVILDGKSLERRHGSSRRPTSAGATLQVLVDHGVTVTASSPAFSIMHVKAMVVDDARLYVMSLNLTRWYDRTRDYAVVTDDRGVVAEFDRVFAADVDNAQNRTKNTPPLSDPALVWSPVDAEPRIVTLLDSAKKTVVATTENLGDKAVAAALARAATRGVAVRLLAPLCDEGGDPLRNLKFVRDLDGAHVDARLMPPPASREQPYMHAKMILVDGARGFVGSINFSDNSMKRARELGIVFEDPAAITSFARVFDSDWRFAEPPPGETEEAPALCKSE